MPKPVQRWNLGNISIKREDNETGQFVLHDDHQIVVDALEARVAELEAREQRIREAAFHPFFNSLESVATIKTILTLG